MEFAIFILYNKIYLENIPQSREKQEEIPYEENAKNEQSNGGDSFVYDFDNSGGAIDECGGFV